MVVLKSDKNVQIYAFNSTGSSNEIPENCIVCKCYLLISKQFINGTAKSLHYTILFQYAVRDINYRF